MVSAVEKFTRLGVSTVYEASGRQGLIDTELIQLLPGSRVCGPARTVLCAQNDNLMVHAAMAAVQPGDVLVLVMPEEAPVALVGDLLATQAQRQGAAALLIAAAVRDVEELQTLGLPMWSRFVRSRGATRLTQGRLNVPVQVGGTTIRPGDLMLLDTDGAIAIAAERVEEVLSASVVREAKEAANREKFQSGILSVDLYGLRDALADHLGAP